MAISLFSSILLSIWAVLKTWWWVLFLIVLWRPLLYLWLWWRNDKYAQTLNNILVELIMPGEVERPFRAMEQVFAGFWMFYDPADWWEKWVEGKYQFGISLEITSIGGDIRFFLRFPKPLRNLVESSIYAQYPEIEIKDAQDYTQDAPQDIPNEQWDMWGCDYEFIKPDFYPIKTYSKFFEESPAPKEIKRIDPLAALLEGMAKANPGEQIWVQMYIKPVTNAENNYKDRAKTEVDKLANRPAKTKIGRAPLIKDAVDVLITGQPLQPLTKEETKEFIPPEMKLTPGEREVVGEIEKKVGKTMFNCFIRFIILGEKDKWNKANLKNVLGFFANFNTENLNGFKPWGPSITKIHKHERFFTNIFFYDTLLYLRKRRLFRQYRSRLRFTYPGQDKTFILNLEELASMYHVVGRSAVPAPMVQRVEAKKSEPPVNLPG